MAHELIRILNRLEQAMRDIDCWQDAPVDPSALMSEQPFCVDTLSFEQWLQFLLIPRLSALIEGQLPLPTSSGIYEMATLYFKNRSDANLVLQSIQDIDDALGNAQ